MLQCSPSTRQEAPSGRRPGGYEGGRAGRAPHVSDYIRPILRLFALISSFVPLLDVIFASRGWTWNRRSARGPRGVKRNTEV
ncbi:hypothetical protein E2C01_037573 [Portunus trituberculatus]|uniref:Uncharacterized protein n=1 Tax=Portunus trituberculatus TaxID=210409 RepID=A0A5B7FEB3_PORTR|nr:hypothetical protein [Portunus trituberculatus]